jgi:hypothetical protein
MIAGPARGGSKLDNGESSSLACLSNGAFAIPASLSTAAQTADMIEGWCNAS